ncbi:hypothetical protein HMPREF0202_02441, partial [Cetobacterium somerae ATCC BAA-474]
MQKNFFYLGIGLLLGGLLLLALLVFKIDPLQQFGSNEYGKGEQRLLNPGIAKNYNYKVAVIGTSTSENILKKDLERLFNKEAINLSISGSTNYEQRRLLEIILQAKKVNTIIYGLDVFSYNTELNESRVPLQEFVYKDSKIAKIKYLYNFEILKNVLKGIIEEKNYNWLESYSYWGDNHTYLKDKVLNFNSDTPWGFQNTNELSELKKGYSYKKMKENFDEFYKLIEFNPQVEYKIYFPPYSSIWWYFVEKYNCLEDILKFKYYVINKLKNQKNVAVYDFQFKENITDNLDNYKDVIHYGPMINKEIIVTIKNTPNLLEENPDLNYEIRQKREYIKLIKEKYNL